MKISKPGVEETGALKNVAHFICKHFLQSFRAIVFSLTHINDTHISGTHR